MSGDLLTNCAAGFHEWDALGGHCRHCGECDEYLGKHSHGTKAETAVAGSKANPKASEPDPDILAFQGFPSLPPIVDDGGAGSRISYGVRPDGSWGPIRTVARVS
jgi:hypothetical protein